MIRGEGFLADSAREWAGDVDFEWWCYHPALPEFLLYPEHPVCVISTPILCGTTRKLEAQCQGIQFIVVPENMRHGGSWADQTHFIIGSRTPPPESVTNLFHPGFHTTPEVAEMVKHATNAFLANTIDFAHNLARVSQAHGADPHEVAQGLLLDPRINGYLRPDGDISPDLQREVDNMKRLGW